MSRDLIYRQDAVDALDKRFDDVPMELTVEILQLRRDLRERIPSAQPDLQPTCNQLAKDINVPCKDTISRQVAIDDLHGKDPSQIWDTADVEVWINELPSTEPEIIRCKNCKHWMPYDWMFSELYRSQNVDDYSEDEIGCRYCDMNMRANDYCSRAERKENG